MITAQVEPAVVIDWTRPSRRTFAANLTWLLPAFGSALLSWLIGGFTLQPEPLIRSAVIGGIFVLLMVAEMITASTTRYRVTADRFELTKGLLFRTRKSVARSRIRSVQTTAGPVQRLLGLQRIKISAGQAAQQDTITLSGLRVADADRLRAALRPTGADAAEADPDTLLIFSRDWLRYAPLTVWGVGGVALLALVGYRGLGVFGLQPEQVWAWAAPLLGSWPLWQLVLAGVVLLVGLGIALSMIVFVEEWWRLRLSRSGRDWLSMERGLLAHRRLGLDLRRLRGMILSEPLLGRLAGGARVEPLSVSAAAEEDEENKSGSMRYLTPVIPRDEAAELAGRVLPEAPSLADPELVRHPPAARRRRVVRGLVVSMIIVAGLLITALVTDQPWWWLGVGLAMIIVVPLAVLLGTAEYRSLGHGSRGGHLILRSGLLDRRTTVLAHDGIIGWRISQSPLQRRAGLLTLTATSAACRRGGCTVADLAPDQAADLIRATGVAGPAERS
ncbi:PH domain-containing protein [Microlunatus speluncae]|uniref:PH domain-containing protein n=1 Tax=Microlunatus speluncae TaxID=2594267 RepID=UPI0012663260|nr:PH domain-containing protein [Microlunatus speluncae]